MLDISAILVVGIVVRFGYLLRAPLQPVTWFDGITAFLGAKAFFIHDSRPFWDMAAVRGPGYPVFLALTAKIFGPNPAALNVAGDEVFLNGQLAGFWAVRLLQGLLGAGTAVLLYLIGLKTNRELGRPVGMIAAILFALSPSQILHTSLLLTEVPAIFLLWSSIALLPSGPQDQNALRRYLMAGGALGLACLTRPTLMPASAVVLAAILIAQKGRLWGQRGWCALSFALPLFALLVAWRAIAVANSPYVLVGAEGLQDQLKNIRGALIPVCYAWPNDRAACLPPKEVHWMVESWQPPAGVPSPASIPPQVASLVAGQTAHVAVSAYAQEPASQFAVALSAGPQGSSGWQRFTATTATQDFSFDYHVPLIPLGNQLGVFVDPEQARGLTIDRLLITRANEPRSLRSLSLRVLVESIPRVANLISCNLWFAEDARRKGNVVPRVWVEGLQHAELLLALAGLSFALLEWRSWLVILAVIVALSPMFAELVEARHNLPGMPAVFLLAALFVVHLSRALARLKLRHALRYSTAGAVLLAPFLLRALVWMGVSRSLAGHASEVAIFPALALYAVLFFRFENGRGRSPIAVGVAAIVPVLILASGVSSYLYVGTVPRWWQYSRLDLCQTTGPPMQQVSLARPIPVDTVASAQVLLDVETRSPSLPLRVRLNGTAISPLTDSRQSRLPTVTDELGLTDYTHQRFTNLYGRTMTSWPQWWAIPFDPALLRDAKDLSISLEARAAACTDPILLGATYGAQTPGMRTGPSITNNSLYRWVLLSDWRFWETSPIGSLATQSMVRSTQAPGSGRDPKDLAIEGLLGIRILIKYKDGNLEVF